MLNIILSIVFALSGAVLILLSGIILRENPRGRINRVTAAMLFFAGIAPVFATIYYAILVPSQKDFPSWIYNLSYAWELFFPNLVLFSAIFPTEHRYFRAHPRYFYLAFLPHIAHLLMLLLFSDPGAVMSALTFRSDIPIIGVFIEYISYFTRLFAVFLSLALDVHIRTFSIVNLIYVVIATIFLHQGMRTVINPRIRKQVRVIVYGIVIAVGLYTVAYIIPSIFNLKLSPQIQYSLIILSLLVGPGSIAWAIMKHRFLDIRLIVRQSLVYSIASIIVVGGYIIIINRFGRILQNILGADIIVLEVAVMMLALIFFQPVLNSVEGLLKKVIIKGGSDFRITLEKFSSRIITLIQFDKLIEETLSTFGNELLIENVYMCIPSMKGESLLYLPGASGPEPESVKKDRVLESFLVVRELPVSVDELPFPALAVTTRRLLRERKTEIIIPLISSHRLLGYIALGRKASGMGYNAEDLTTFRVLANQLVIAINNARHYQKSLERQRMEEELALARQIQQQLLPKVIPSDERLQFAAYSEPSREVGGDYYDIFSTTTAKLAFGIGDASGKGVPASLMAARMQAILHSVANSDIEVSAKISHINSVLSMGGIQGSFITFFYGEIDPVSLEMRFCNAGHNYPFVFRESGVCQFLRNGGLVLGAFTNATYESGSIQLQHNDLMVCFTDGISEAMDSDGIEFGEKRLHELVLSHRRRPLDDIKKSILEEINKHCAGVPPQDDCTFLIMRVL